ncbi:MAG: hypothetical protein H6719_30835 [Sandaracinaceae bacterium]|nr:hypothetical protein [Sandaracinaceae bacterium]
MRRAPIELVTITRRISTHLLLGAALLFPATASAQLGRALGAPLASAPAPIDAATSSTSLMPEGWALDLTAQTSLPVSVGIEAQLTTPVGLFATVSAGHTPNAYLGMLRDIVEGTGAFGEDVRPIVDETIANGGWNVRVGVGVNPIEGLELSFGYTYLGTNSTLTRAAIESATGQRIRYRGMREVPVAIEMHALHGRVGYRLVIEEHLVLRAAIGWTHAVGASAHLEVPPEIRELEGNPATEIEDGVGAGFAQYGFTPEILISAGYRF